MLPLLLLLLLLLPSANTLTSRRLHGVHHAMFKRAVMMREGELEQRCGMKRGI